MNNFDNEIARHKVLTTKLELRKRELDMFNEKIKYLMDLIKVTSEDDIGEKTASEMKERANNDIYSLLGKKGAAQKQANDYEKLLEEVEKKLEKNGVKRNAAGEWTTYNSCPAPPALANPEDKFISEKAPTALANKKKKVDELPLPRQPTLWSLGFKSKGDEPKRLEVRLPDGHPCICSRVFKNLAGLVGHQINCNIYKEDMELRRKKMRDSIAPKVKILKQPTIVDFEKRNQSQEVIAVDGDSELEIQSNEENEESLQNKKELEPNNGGSGKKYLKKLENVSKHQTRKRYDLEFKLFALDSLQRVTSQYIKIDQHSGLQQLFAERLGIAPSTLSEWNKNRKSIIEKALLARGSKGRGNRRINLTKVGSGPSAALPYAEEIVYKKFRENRFKGKSISGRSLRLFMLRETRKIAVTHTLPNPIRDRAANFKASATWLRRFCARYNLTLRKRTNAKSKNAELRAPVIRRWHALLRYRQSKGNSEYHDMHWGRWRPEQVFNVDQVPYCPTTSNTTYDTKGERRIQIANSEASDKRFCTLQLAVRLSNDNTEYPQPRLAIIFHGQGKKISKEERNAWDPRVDVYFQSNAWADTDFCVDYCRKTLAPVFENTLNKLKAKGQKCAANGCLLLMDNLSSHVSQDFQTEVRKVGAKPHFLPAGCTDWVQAIDHHGGVTLKNRMQKIMELEFIEDSAFHDEWLGLNGVRFSASKKRIKITKWAAEAWEDMCNPSSPEYFDWQKAGFSTGSLMSKSGKYIPVGCSEPVPVPPIKIDGIPGYSFSDTDMGRLPNESDEEDNHENRIVQSTSDTGDVNGEDRIEEINPDTDGVNHENQLERIDSDSMDPPGSDIDDEMEAHFVEEDDCYDDTCQDFPISADQLGNFEVVHNRPEKVYGETVAYLLYYEGMEFGFWKIGIVGRRSKNAKVGCHPIKIGTERHELVLDPALYGQAACSGSWVILKTRF